MKTGFIRATALAVALTAVPLTGALADDPSLDERQYIADALRAEGFTGWGRIKWDDGVWEVKNAVGPDGRKYDVELDRDFQILDIDD